MQIIELIVLFLLHICFDKEVKELPPNRDSEQELIRIIAPIHSTQNSKLHLQVIQNPTRRSEFLAWKANNDVLFGRMAL